MTPAAELAPLPALPTRLRRRWRQGGAVFFYHLLRQLLRRAFPQAQFQLRRVIWLPPWRLRLPPRQPRQLRVAEVPAPAPGPDGGGLGLAFDAVSRLRPGDRAAFARRFAQGDRCLAAYLEDRCVAFLWLRLGPSQLPTQLGSAWQIPATAIWIYDIYSDPQVLGAIAPLYAHLRQHPPGTGFDCLVGQIEFDNFRSRQAHRSLGYVECATVWSLGWGRHRLHGAFVHPRAGANPAVGAALSALRPRRWRVHRGHHLIPLHLLCPLSARAPEAPQGTPPQVPHGTPPAAPWGTEAPRALLRCACGNTVAYPAEPLQCLCGRSLGAAREGVAQLGDPIPYWGEIPQSAMRAVLERAAAAGCEAAVRELVPASLYGYILGSHRADFQDVLPLPADARVLDIGAGWGGISCQLARRYQVVALEGVGERAQFIALRARQLGLRRLAVLAADMLAAPLQPTQFDLIVANGVLEWVALLDLSASPGEVQLRFLDRLRSLLRPGGLIYLGIENRFGHPELRGELDHSGLPYTSLLPRPLARWVCAHSSSYRSQFNVGYRTYTYSHRGYARLFRQVGLEIAATWVSPAGYNDPEKLVPLSGAAIQFMQRAPRPAANLAGWARRQLRRQAARPWVWRWVGSDFAFALRPAVARAEKGPDA